MDFSQEPPTGLLFLHHPLSAQFTSAHKKASEPKGSEAFSVSQQQIAHDRQDADARHQKVEGKGLGDHIALRVVAVDAKGIVPLRAGMTPGAWECSASRNTRITASPTEARVRAKAAPQKARADSTGRYTRSSKIGPRRASG